jgi:hypothetical protein
MGRKLAYTGDENQVKPVRIGDVPAESTIEHLSNVHRVTGMPTFPHMAPCCQVKT